MAGAPRADTHQAKARAVSYCFDILAKSWARLESKLPVEVRDSEEAARFGLLLEELHEANHRLGDSVNKDQRVRRQASKLDEAMTTKGEI